MTPVVLMIISAAVIGLLGLAHLLLTFRGPKLLPRDETLQAAMDQGHLRITRQTTIWRAWIGFNASHSIGAILFGFVYGYLAWSQPQMLFDSGLLLGVGVLVLTAYLVLAKRYWFSSPLLGISISLICYVLAVGASRL